MKNKRLIPFFGMVVGLVLGVLFELFIWKSLNVSNSNGIVNVPTRPSGGIPFGPGIPAIMSTVLGGLIGVLISEIFLQRNKR
mgnify:CR=1 FL=1